MALGEQHSVKVPADVYAMLVEQAKSQDRSIASVLRRALLARPEPGSEVYEAVVNHYLDANSKARVLDRWRKAGKR